MDINLNSRSLGANSINKYRAGLIATFGGVVGLAVVRVMASFGFFDLFDSLPLSVGELLSSLIWPVLGGAVIPFFLYFWLSGTGKFTERFSAKTIGKGFNEFGFGKVSYGILLLSILLGTVYAVANSGIAIVSQNILIALGFRLGGGSSEMGGIDYLIATCITSAVMPALFEEFTCRGTLLRSLQRHGEIKAIFLSALVFGLFHMNLAQTFFTFVMGLVTAFITIRLRSIWPAVIIHFINNFGGTVLYYLYAKGLPGKQFYEFVNNIAVNAPFVLLGIWGVAIMLSVMVIYGMLRYLKHHDSFLEHKQIVANRRKKLDEQRELVSASTAEGNANFDLEATAEAEIKEKINTETSDSLLDTESASTSEFNANPANPVGATDMYSNLHSGLSPHIAADHSGYDYAPKYIDKMWFIATLIVAGGATLFSIIWAVM